MDYNHVYFLSKLFEKGKKTYEKPTIGKWNDFVAVVRNGSILWTNPATIAVVVEHVTWSMNFAIVTWQARDVPL